MWRILNSMRWAHLTLMQLALLRDHPLLTDPPALTVIIVAADLPQADPHPRTTAVDHPEIGMKEGEGDPAHPHAPVTHDQGMSVPDRPQDIVTKLNYIKIVLCIVLIFTAIL